MCAACSRASRQIDFRSEREVLSEIGFPDFVVGQYLIRSTGCNDMPLANDVGAFTNIQCFTDIVIGDQHANVPRFEMRDDVFDVGDRDGINPLQRVRREESQWARWRAHERFPLAYVRRRTGPAPTNQPNGQH